MAYEQTSEELRDRSIPELVKQLADQTSTLVRQELDLAKAEMTQKGREAGKGAGLLGGAAFVGLLAGVALTAFLILVLDTFMVAWLAALIVTVVMAAIAGFLALKGRDRMRAATPPVPQQTVETVKEDVEWAKTQTPSART
jgi:predicted lipid-binding transport protein (Tim44 family)